MTSARRVAAAQPGPDGHAIATPPPPGAGRGGVAARIVAAAVLGVQIVAMLLVGTYARRGPQLWGLPFFYWYSLVWLPVGAVSMAGCVWLLGRFPDRTAPLSRLGPPVPAARSTQDTRVSRRVYRLGEHPHHDRAVQHGPTGPTGPNGETIRPTRIERPASRGGSDQ
ncbi:hypothetical protein FAIPA1_60177 [Frankia sp. AiPs1]|uniref:DUF3311 domain-containing protein n=1 Tax=Frankia sp. AiPa1 TaxID=573492 RepID=UPI00202B80BE|nr:DUF3311 domain-containing protein [Frankia sp. AiPa1]MCL9760588.1 DUF3311 domain-containing protein [Frankia sp. AiPa1]